MQTKKDSQNQYRTGVLISNHVEDRFGRDLVHNDAKPSYYKSEAHDNFSIEKTMYQYGRENHQAKPITEDEILEDKKYKDYEESMFSKRGVKSNVFFGHGANQDAFGKRDFGTTNDLFFQK